MSFTWVEHRDTEKKSEEKMVKYGAVLFELKKQYLSYDVEQYNLTSSLTCKGDG